MIYDAYACGQRCGGRQTQHSLHAQILLEHLADHQITRSKVVTPLRHTMRFINAGECDRWQLPQDGTKSCGPLSGYHCLRRDKQYIDFPIGNHLLYLETLTGCLICVQAMGAQKMRHTSNLILHQRHQRRYDQCNGAHTAAIQIGRQLIAQRFAAACTEGDQCGQSAEYAHHSAILTCRRVLQS